MFERDDYILPTSNFLWQWKQLVEEIGGNYPLDGPKYKAATSGLAHGINTYVGAISE